MDPSLPPALGAAIAAMIKGRSGRDLGARAAEISRHYRAHAPSSRAVTSQDDALAYALTRMPATYAAVRSALEALLERAPDWAPRSLLDAGCGPGTAAWAAAEAFDLLEVVWLLDANRPLLDLARSLAGASESEALRNAALTLGDLSAPGERAHLVTAAYVLTELSDAAAIQAAAHLWTRTEGVLLIVEPGTPDAWARLMKVRSMLINQGAAILAPCPHLDACPLAAPDWCHFVQRLPRSRSHIAAKAASAPYEDEKFAYLAAARPGVATSEPRPRVLAPPLRDKAGVMLKLCTREGRLEAPRVAKRDKAAFSGVRKARWGDVV
jgi:ribosomal protein RSM22 (predicted rRNA methylase)